MCVTLMRVCSPYFCAGSMVRHLARLGFHNVVNRNEDFYAAIAEGRVPEYCHPCFCFVISWCSSYDVLVTNPPFSTTPVDHIARLYAFVAEARKPFLILQPNYVYTKPFHAQVLLL